MSQNTQDFIVPNSIDFIEFAVKDLKTAHTLYQNLGFTCLGTKQDKNACSELWVQGDVRVVLTASDDKEHEAGRFVRAHGDGIMNIGIAVDDAKWVAQFLNQFNTGEHPCTQMRGLDGSTLGITTHNVYGDVKHLFFSGASNGKPHIYSLFEEAKNQTITMGTYVQTLDHITVNVEMGRMDHWANHYKKLFGMTEVRYFDIKTDRTGLYSRALRTPNGKLTMPFNEPADARSQIQEFLNTFRGPGIQHIALHTVNIISTLKTYKQRGLSFLSVPDSYYDAVPTRVPNVAENLDELKALNILVDGSDKGYLLQIFTENLVGPFFYELIQRKGDQGFGDGNFKALFESIERDQMRRGVL